MTPAIPATAAAIPKAKSFVLWTLTPADAAALSFARTAKNRRPVEPRRKLATMVHKPANTMRQNNVNLGLSVRPELLVDPISAPKNVGAPNWYAEPPCNFVADGLSKNNVHIEIAAAMVTTASCTPRIRNAGTATMSPTMMATMTPMTEATGHGQ